MQRCSHVNLYRVRYPPSSHSSHPHTSITHSHHPNTPLTSYYSYTHTTNLCSRRYVQGYTSSVPLYACIPWIMWVCGRCECMRGVCGWCECVSGVWVMWDECEEGYSVINLLIVSTWEYTITGWDISVWILQLSCAHARVWCLYV